MTWCPEVTGYGLLLWHLRRPNKEHLLCQVGECDSHFVLAIRDQARDTCSVAERFDDLASLLSRAQVLRDAYVGAGWQERAAHESQHTGQLAW